MRLINELKQNDSGREKKRTDNSEEKKKELIIPITVL